MTSLHSKIHDHLMTRDWDATHKLKLRLFIKVILCFDVFPICQSLLFGYFIITKYYLFSKVVQYTILVYHSIYNSAIPSSIILFLT